MLEFIRDWLRPTKYPKAHIHGTNFFIQTGKRIMQVTMPQKFTEKVKEELLAMDGIISIED